METKHNPQESLDEMVFENRNKAYGAYQLRKLYPKHLTQASFYAVGLFVFLFTFPAMVTEVTGEAERPFPIAKPELGKHNMTQVKLIEMVEPTTAAKPVAPIKSGPTIKNVVPKVVEETNKPQEDIPTQDQLKTATGALTTSKGTGEPVDTTLPLDGGDGGGNGTAPAGDATAKPEVFISVEQMPEFEGGMNALMKFVGKNLRYPPAAQRSAIEGTVVLSFVVSPSGEIADIQVLKGLGYGTEEEVIRVVQKMPRWKPGMQNGKAVPVRFTLPVRLEMK